MKTGFPRNGTFHPDTPKTLLTMTANTKAKFYAILTGLLGLLSALAALPPSDQTTFLAAILAVLPPDWRGEATAIVHLLMVGSFYLTAHYASNAAPIAPTNGTK